MWIGVLVDLENVMRVGIEWNGEKRIGGWWKVLLELLLLWYGYYLGMSKVISVYL